MARCAQPAGLCLFALCLVLGFSGAVAKPSKEDGIAYLKENANKDGVVVLPSGLQYKVLRAGDGKFHPAVDAACDVHYEGTFIDGGVFDSSYKRGKPLSLAPNRVIKGWTQAMQLMTEGDKWQLFIPSDLAYGAGGNSGIPGGSTLLFTMELIKINGRKVPAEPQGEAAKPPADASAAASAAAAAAKATATAATVTNGQQLKPMKVTDSTQFMKSQGAAGLRAKMKAYSWNVFRYIGDYLHLTGIVVLFVTIGKNGSVAGISKKTQILYLCIFCLRYMDLMDHSQTAYLVFFKLTYTVTAVIILGIFWKMQQSYESRKDTCSLVVICVPCVTAAVLLSDDYSFMEIAWTCSQFLEGFAMVPQYIFCYRDKGAKDWGVSFFVIALGGYRVFYVLNWIYKKVYVPQYSDIQSWIGGIIELMFFVDFLNSRFTGYSMLRTVVLQLDEKVNEIQEKVEMKVLGSSRSTRQGEVTEGGGELRRRGGKSERSTEMSAEV